jgi:hypothetical protein
MSSVSAPSPAAPVAAESQAGPALQLAEAGGRGRPWLRFPSSPPPRLWPCDVVALTLAYASGTSWDFDKVIAKHGIRRTSLLAVAILRVTSQALSCPPRWAAYCGALGR